MLVQHVLDAISYVCKRRLTLFTDATNSKNGGEIAEMAKLGNLNTSARIHLHWIDRKAHSTFIMELLAIRMVEGSGSEWVDRLGSYVDAGALA